MRRASEWQAGEHSVQRRVDAWLNDPTSFSATALHDNPRRILQRLDDDTGLEASCVIKRHRSRTGRHPLREAVKRLLGRSPARREWRALDRLHAAGIAVPRPLAWARLADGDELVVSEWRQGIALQAAFDRAHEPAQRNRLLDALSRSVSALHAAGWRHGDLHQGNLLVEPDRITLLDLQRARPLRYDRQRLDDLAQLEFSLARIGLTPSERQRLRSLLGVDEALDRSLRRFLRDYLRGRARRVLRVGRRWSRVKIGERSGRCEASLAAREIAKWIADAEKSTGSQERRGGRTRIIELKQNDRCLIVKRMDAGSLGRALADRVRGSAAARAFETGQRLSLLGELAPRPLAFLEERALGLPRRSWLLLETVGEEDLDRYQPTSETETLRCAQALGAWLAECHAWGLHHRDLKAGNIRITATDANFRFWWLDLEDIVITARVGDAARLHALAQLNASLADAVIPVSARRAAFDAYCARLPFAMDVTKVLREIVRQSLARAHRWRGERA